MIHNRKILSLLVCILYIFNILTVWRDYYLRFMKGEFPVEADSIGLPMGLYLIVWLFGILLVALVIWAIFRSRTDGKSLLAINHDRPLINILVGLVTVFLVSWNIFYILESMFDLDPVNLVYASFEIYLFLCLRVVFVFLK